MKRRIACMIMAMVLAISLVPLGAITAKAASSLTYSENVVSLIKQFEGFSASAYWDVNQWTIGYGTTGTQGQTMTEEQADLALRERLNVINTKINEFTANNNLYLNQYQHDALISFSFNCGTDWTTQGGRFYEAVTKNADVNTFLFAISLWANVNSTPDATLINRRLAEANLYLNGVYSKSAPSAYTYVIFDPNGGTAGSNGEDKMQAYLSGSNVSILVADASKSGVSFGGWFTASSGGTGVKYLSSSTAGTTLYAQYGTPVSVTSSYCYVRNGAGSNYTQTGTVASGTQLVIVETAQVNGVQWGRYIDGWVELSNTNYISGGSSSSGSSSSGTAVSTGTVVCNTGVNVRSGAGTGYSIVGSAYNGQRISIYETVSVNGSFWGRIGDNRWISLNYVKLDSNSGSSSGSSSSGVIWEGGGSDSSTTTYQLGTVTATKLNVRSAAGVGNSIVGSLTKGTQIKIYSTSVVNNVTWGKTDAGWVCMNYVQITSSGSSSGSSSSGTAIGTGTVKANTNLNVRSAAGTSAARVGSLSGGTTVTIYEKTTVNGVEWGRIGTNQWVCLAYVVMSSSSGSSSGSSSSSTTTTTGTGTVISSTNLNVRNGAGSNYTRVGSLTPGTQVTIYEAVTNGTQVWGRIGTNQWVCMTYIRLSSSSSSSGSTIVIPSTGYQGKVTTNMNIRAAAGTNNAIVGRLTAGTIVTVYELTTVNGVYWGRISSGWVCMNYIQLTTSSGVTWQ